MNEHWVLNASPLILLGKAGQLEWLPRLGTVVIPTAVVDELRTGSASDPARQFVETESVANWLRDVPASQDVLVWDLGAGETAVISWAIANPNYEAVLDDAAARRCAEVCQIRLRGTLSLVALAKRRGWVCACRPVFARMLDAGL